VTAAAGLYVHVPYCVRRCSYCSFVLTTDFSTRERYFEALRTEADLAAAGTGGIAFDSLYLGGGTPSAVPSAEIAGLAAHLAARFAFAPDSEITVEANPDDVDPDSIRAWRSAGATRVSVGIQSFRDEELRAIDRTHSGEDAARALDLLLGAGFSVSADLMIGIPGQAPGGAPADAARLARMGVGHVSVYMLELDKAGRMAEDRRRRPERYLTDDTQAEAYLEVGRVLADAGFRHDEVSNWSRPGAEARHNAKYWRRAPTLGLGVGAHELWDERRRANTASIGAYLDALSRGVRPTASDQPVDALEREREEIILPARTREGISAERIDRWLAERGDSALRDDWERWMEAGLVERHGDRYALTERGFLVSNEILCRFV
jgi:oxygen-independent coproporphyrinogen-3 oxidase